ncbi:MAG: hypothetical protein WA364_23395 [Candidatus Nitrosopolaris sp.]
MKLPLASTLSILLLLLMLPATALAHTPEYNTGFAAGLKNDANVCGIFLKGSSFS